MVRILLTNDDGIEAPGIAVLRRALDGMGDVTTLAPDANTSAVARGITIDRALHARPVEFGGGYPGLALDGTPVDCVRVGLLGVVAPAPDVVLSGVNLGANMGADVTYSGTVGAALEAAMRGVPAVAFSVESREPGWLDETAPLLRGLVAQVLRHGLPRHTALNVNLPDRPARDIVGLRVARLGGASCHDRVFLSGDGRDGDAVTEYYVPCERPPADHWADVDFDVVAAGCVALTPLQDGVPSEAALERIARWDLDLRRVAAEG